ncbi:hypothetical protein RclHR1_00090043 [Rhizophagus clarus]|uniref:Uncharacterized protein n=1 Tax=Rhizophagus clarus TaxID=94130 RepID=A0A2Z6SPI3_9GLOM|nr:hypothetical protein RclHR1_00090043 [Rhizophagus clarus]
MVFRLVIRFELTNDSVTGLRFLLQILRSLGFIIIWLTNRLLKGKGSITYILFNFGCWVSGKEIKLEFSQLS